jgi:hypothetical protein
MRRWRVAGSIALALLMLGAVPAAAQEDAPEEKAAPRGRPFDLPDDAPPIRQRSEASRTATADAVLAATPCYVQGHTDPNEPTDQFLDAVAYSLRHDCEFARWTLSIRTVDSWPIEDLALADLTIDTDANFTNGCFGGDYYLFIAADGAGVAGGLFRTPSCENVTLVSGDVLWGMPAGNPGNTLEIEFPGGPLLGARQLRWYSTILSLNDDLVNFTDYDFLPDVNYWVSPGNPCGGRCFYLRNALGSGAHDVFFKDDEPASQVVVGDWNADGVDSFGFRNGRTLAVKNALAAGPPASTVTSGLPTDRLLVGDWDGDGDDTFALRRGSTFYIKNSLTGGAADITYSSGLASDTVVVGDWDGDGDDTFALRRGSTFYIKNSLTGGAADITYSSGLSTDRVLAGDWDGDGDDTFALRRGRTSYLKNSLTGGAADVTFNSGLPTDASHSGDWNGDGSDSLGLRR